MIYNQSIKSKDINIKKFLKYSDNYTLIPIKYKNNDLIIQTPKMYIPYGEKFVYNNNDKKYVDISFQNIENDKNIELFYHNLDIIHSKINKHLLISPSPSGLRRIPDEIIQKYPKNTIEIQ